jgi:hypothetical protein
VNKQLKLTCPYIIVKNELKNKLVTLSSKFRDIKRYPNIHFLTFMPFLERKLYRQTAEWHPMGQFQLAN